jgi:hypothetical protein
MTLYVGMYGFKYLKSKVVVHNMDTDKFMSVVFGWTFVQNLRVKIYPRSFRPKRSFSKSIPGQDDNKTKTESVVDQGFVMFIHLWV